MKKCLNAEFREADTQELHNLYQLSDESHPLLKKAAYMKAAENAEIPFKNAADRLVSDPYVLNDTKKAWEGMRGRSNEGELLTAQLTFLEHLACLFIHLFNCCLDSDDRYVHIHNNDAQIQRIQIRSEDARSRRIETNALIFFVTLPLYLLIYLVKWMKSCLCLCMKMQREPVGQNDNVAADGEENENDYVSISFISYPSLAISSIK